MVVIFGRSLRKTITRALFLPRSYSVFVSRKAVNSVFAIGSLDQGPWEPIAKKTIGKNTNGAPLSALTPPRCLCFVPFGWRM